MISSSQSINYCHPISSMQFNKYDWNLIFSMQSRNCNLISYNQSNNCNLISSMQSSNCNLISYNQSNNCNLFFSKQPNYYNVISSQYCPPLQFNFSDKFKLQIIFQMFLCTEYETFIPIMHFGTLLKRLSFLSSCCI